jgi:hypothetical protein
MAQTSLGVADARRGARVRSNQAFMSETEAQLRNERRPDMSALSLANIHSDDRTEYLA